MKINIKLLLLLFILILGFLLRFYRLGSNPPGLNLDEVSIGYDAYSVLKTGKDQFGGGTPAYFRSHDDYKPPLLIYLAVPSTAVFGETSFAVRFSSALLGVLAMVGVYFLSAYIVPEKKYFGLLSAFLLAISPWHLQFSRTAYEVGMQPFFTTFGLLFFLKGLKENKWFLTFSAIFFGLSIYLYTASRIFIPLMVFLLGLIYIKDLWGKWAKISIFSVTFLIFLIPTLYLFTTPAGQFRFKGTNIFQDPKPHMENIEFRRQDNLESNSLFAKIFHPDKMAYVQEILYGYFTHFRPDFLFLGRNDPPANYVVNVGLIYLVEIPFLFSGFYYLFCRKDKRLAMLLLSWILLSPLPASVTYGLPTSIRVTIVLPAVQIVIAYGVFGLYMSMKKFFRTRSIQITLLTVHTIITVYLFLYYLHSYYFHTPMLRSQAWYYGYDKVVEKTLSLAPLYSKVIISTNLHQPHSFFLFYSHYDPQRYLTIDGGTVSGGFDEERNHFDKFYFQKIRFDETKNEKNVLYIGRPDDFPRGMTPLYKFYYLDGEPSVWIVSS